MSGLLLIFAGAGIGGVLRQLVGELAKRLLGASFPVGTIAINVTGSLVMGLVAGYLGLHRELPRQWQLFLMTGVLGGYTTFSTFSLDVARLWERDASVLAGVYLGTSVVGSIAAVMVGLAIVKAAA